MSYDGNTPILGSGTVSAEAIDAWYANRGPVSARSYAPDRTYKPAPDGLGQMIIEESRRWAPHVVNHDLVAADIAHESAFWQSAIVRDKHNPSGLGAVNDNAYGGAVRFETPREGIRATVAHLLSYAVGDGPWASADPRYAAVKSAGWLGAAPRLKDLNGKWAYPGTTYGQQVAAAANALVSFANDGSWNPPMAAQIPGFTWYPADADHYDRGRREKIRGGAQHYTAGTNSLNWLAKTSSPPVSVHFLVKHTPTMDDRGWQLVRIEDTAWTTAFANPFTVAIEYEHDGRQSIPDSAYEVLAQTWLDIAAYVTQHNLGEIPITRTGIRGHREWVGNPQLICPDGIDVDRIVRIAQERSQPAPPKPPADDWPKVPQTAPDPHRDSNPYGRFWVPTVFLHEINAHDWMLTGYCMSEAFAERGDDGVTRVVQYFERARLELSEDGTVTRGLCGRESFWCRYPERAPRP